VLLEGVPRGGADGDLVAPEQQRGLLGGEQLRHEQGQLLAELAGRRLRGGLACPCRPELAPAAAMLPELLERRRSRWLAVPGAGPVGEAS
jgi:hypothetical protein